uniref:Predicted protein n=1 Tax=Hordeum vulgare subsp. vulgare TaxID=112509 RepID=F2ECA2_HORVV|nr:predicted protein [Hordeum vulgare subsp. vulgare]
MQKPWPSSTLSKFRPYGAEWQRSGSGGNLSRSRGVRILHDDANGLDFRKAPPLSSYPSLFLLCEKKT